MTVVLLGMLSYDTDGTILTIRAAGAVNHAERLSVFGAIRGDARVSNSTLVLLNLHAIRAAVSKEKILERTRTLREELGRKLGPACAKILGANLKNEGHLFREAAIVSGLHVGIFEEEKDAREWLLFYRIIHSVKA